MNEDNLQTLRDLFDRYRRQKLRTASRTTLHQHEVSQRSLERFLGRSPYLRELTDELLLDWSSWWLGTAGPVTVNKSIAKVLAVWRWGARKGIVERWPDYQRLKEPERIPLAWTIEQFGSLLRTCRQEQGSILGVPAGLWWESLHLVAYDTGERIGALLQAKWDWLDCKSRTLVLPAETRKGGRKPACYDLYPDTIELLMRIKTPARPLIWPWALTPCSLYLHYRRILRSAELPADRWSKFHRIRRTTASHLAREGGNPTERLGHSSSKVTQAYLDPRIVGVKPVSSLLPRPG